MATRKTSKLPSWYTTARRADQRELARLQDDPLSPDDAALDWRFANVSPSDLIAELGPNLRDYVEREIIEFEPFEEEDALAEMAECDRLTAAMLKHGTDAWFAANPVFCFIEADGKTYPYPREAQRAVAIAHHTFELERIPVWAAPSNSSRFLPLERAPRWKNSEGWSAHIMDDHGPLFNDGYTLHGPEFQAVLFEIAGRHLNGELSADAVAKLNADATAWNSEERGARADYLEDDTYGAWKEAVRHEEMIDAAADPVLEFLDLCENIGRGMVVGPDAAKY